MNIDWNEINKGLEAELAKTASEPLEKEASLGAAWQVTKSVLPWMLRAAKATGPAVANAARAAAPYAADAIEGTGKVLGRTGDILNSGLGVGLQGVERAAEGSLPYIASGIEGAGKVLKATGPAVANAARAAAPYAADAIEGTGKVLGRTGDKLNALVGSAPRWAKATAAGIGIPAITETIAPETHKEIMNNSSWWAKPYHLGDDVKDGLKGAVSAAKVVSNVAGSATQGGADLLEAVTPRGEPATGGSAGNTIHENLERAARATEAGGQAFTDFTGKVKNFFNAGKDTVSKLYETGTKGLNDYFGGMGDMGKYIPAIGGLLAGGLGAYLLTRKKPSQGGYGYGGGMPAININVGGGGLQGRRMPPGFLNNDPTQVQSLGSYKEGSLLKGADIVDALSSAVGRRMADKVLNSAAGPGKASPQHEEHPKVLEVTSKHPHMTKLLKNKKNKEYLENLLKE